MQSESDKLPEQAEKLRKAAEKLREEADRTYERLILIGSYSRSDAPDQKLVRSSTASSRTLFLCLGRI